MKENVAVLVALASLVLPWIRDEAESPSQKRAVEKWDGTGMPPDERYADWS